MAQEREEDQSLCDGEDAPACLEVAAVLLEDLVDAQRVGRQQLLATGWADGSIGTNRHETPLLFVVENRVAGLVRAAVYDQRSGRGADVLALGLDLEENVEQAAALDSAVGEQVGDLFAERSARGCAIGADEVR